MISPKLKQFVQQYSDWINNPDMHPELVQNIVEDLNYRDTRELYQMLKSIGVDLDEYRWNFFDYVFLSMIEDNRKNPYPPDDPSGSWSRLSYILDGMGQHGFKYDEILQHLLDPENMKRLDLNLTPLEIGYGWAIDNEYDLGWFKKEKYRQMYPEEFED